MYKDKPQEGSRINELEFREMERDRKGISDNEAEFMWNFCLDYTKKKEEEENEKY